MEALQHGGIQKRHRTYCFTYTHSATHAYKWNHVLIKGSDAWTHTHRSSVKCSITADGAISLFLVLVLSPVPPVWVPPTHPSVPIGAQGPRVHLASSSVSVELSPMMATTSLNVPADLFRETK